MSEDFNQLDKFASAYENENDEENCVVLINGKRFKYKTNVVVFESEARALKVLRNSAWRWFRWNQRVPNFDEVFDKWVEERVSFVPAENYYPF